MGNSLNVGHLSQGRGKCHDMCWCWYARCAYCSVENEVCIVMQIFRCDFGSSVIESSLVYERESEQQCGAVACFGCCCSFGS